MRNDKRFILVVIFIFISLFSFSEGRKEGILVKAKGFATAPNYVVKQLALEDAIKNGFEQYLLSIIPEKYCKYLQSIINKSSKYIVSLKITDEILTRDTCSIEIELELDDESICRDVSTFIMPYLETLPSVLILKGGNIKTGSTISIDGGINILVKKMKELKFNVSTDTDIFDLLEEQDTAFVSENFEIRKHLVMASDYDIVVFVTHNCITEKIHPLSDFTSCKSSLGVEIFRGDDGKLLDSFTSTSVVNSYLEEEGIRQSLEDAMLASLPKIVSSSILGYLNRANDRSVIIKLEKFKDNSIVGIITTYLEKITYGCKTEVLCNFPGLVKIKLYYDGPIVHIVDSLQNFSDLKNLIYIKKVVDRNLEIVPKKDNEK